MEGKQEVEREGKNGRETRSGKGREKEREREKGEEERKKEKGGWRVIFLPASFGKKGKEKKGERGEKLICTKKIQ